MHMNIESADLGRDGASAENWQFPPYSRWAFSNVARLLPTVRIQRPAHASAFALAPADLSALPVTRGGATRSVAELLTATVTDGFLVLHRGRLVYEQYAGALGPGSTHIIMSVSKSMLGDLVGTLVEAGVLDLARTAGHYVPELRADGYGAVTLDRLLDMRSRMRYSEDYADPAAEFFDFDAACGLRPPRHPGAAEGMHAYLAALPADPADPGRFVYRSTDSDVLGWVAERASGTRLEELLRSVLWAPLGAEQDAELLVDAHGAALADGGLCVTLRDLARFAQMHLDDGQHGGRTIVPAAWVQSTRDGDRAAFATSDLGRQFPNGAYSRQWWALDPPRGVQCALGIHGQLIYLDRRAGIACVKLSSQPDPLDAGAFDDTLAVCEAIVRALA